MTTDGDVGLVCRSIFMKPGVSMTESEGEAGEHESIAVGVQDEGISQDRPASLETGVGVFVTTSGR